MTTATKFTMARLALIPVFLICMYLVPCNSVMQLVALVIFAAASLTDLIDGKIARKYNQVTDLGKFLDPLADKVLVIAAMAMFCEWGRFPAWALMIVLFREFAVSGLRMIAAGAPGGKVIAANIWGKAKTVLQMLTIILYYLSAALASPASIGGVMLMAWALCWLVALVTALSGARYLWDNRQFIDTAK